jgi:hypothetical protein
MPREVAITSEELIDLFVQQSRLHASESGYTAGDGFSDDLLVEPARA